MYEWWWPFRLSWLLHKVKDIGLFVLTELIQVNQYLELGVRFPYNPIHVVCIHVSTLSILNYL